MSELRERAQSWLRSQILSTEGCIERLVGIRNDAVNLEAQGDTVKRMRDEVEVWKYLEGLVAADGGESHG